MPLTTRRTGSIIVANDLTNTWAAHDESSSMTSDGWDSLKVTYYRTSETELEIEGVMTEFPIGKQLGLRKFWLGSFEGPTCVAPGIYKLEASFKGFAATKPVVVNYGSVSNQQSGENILVNGSVEPKVNVYENSVTANVRYVLEDITTAPTDDVGTAQTPPSAPAIGASHWAFLTESTYHYPNGWVLMGSTPERLPGTDVALMSDDYQYIQARTP